MSNDFFDEVDKGKVKQPHQMGFSLKKWKKKFESVDDPSEYDQMIFEAGIVFNDLFELIRGDLKTVVEKYPQTDPQVKLKSLCGMSNRNFVVLRQNLRSDMDKLVNDDGIVLGNVHSLVDTNNPNNMNFLYEQVGNMTIDALQKAFVFSFKEGASPSKKDKMSIDGFLYEAMLSNIYYAFEGYWEAVLYGVYTFSYDEAKKEIVFSEENSELGESFTLEHKRKSKLNLIDSYSINNTPIPDSQKYFERLQLAKVGKSKQLRVTNQIDDYLFRARLSFRDQVCDLSDIFPKKLIKDKIEDYDFSILDVLIVFEHMMYLVMSLTGKLPSNTDITKIQNINTFSTKLKIKDLAHKISKVADIKVCVVEAVLSFLTFKGDHNKDIWCHPLVQASSGSVYPLVSPFWSPNVLRLVEHWLLFLKVDVGDKGYKYEDTVANELSSFFAENEIISDVKIEKCVEFKADEQEEIDIVIGLKGLIIVGEAKCIVTSDSARGYGRLVGKVSFGAEQAKRKAELVKNNLSDFCAKVGWDYSEFEDSHIQPLVIVSNVYGTSLIKSEVPVVDLRILSCYFSTNKFSVLSTSSVDSSFNDLVSLLLYSSQKEAVCNFTKYIEKLPQYNGVGSKLELFTNVMPINHDKYSSFKQVQYKQRAFVEDVTAYDFDGEYDFPVIRHES